MTALDTTADNTPIEALPRYRVPLRVPLFATLTGLHLAILQFCYFFTLLINVTSTYVTYMTVVIAWMAGTLAGLWLPIGVTPALVVGVAAYYGVQFLVASDPLGGLVLPVAALGVAVTGLWAGRFFVVLQPRFQRADRLFFHENNGFMVGVLGVFVGFTLLGNAFLLWAPLVTLAVLVLFHPWVARAEPRLVEESATAAPDLPAAPAAADPALLLDGGRSALRRFGWGMIALNILVPAGIFVQAAVEEVGYWHLFWGENNLITWFSALQLLLVAGVAWLNAETAAEARRLHGPEAAAHPWIWWLFAAGFVFLALDEQFRIHEQIRDGLLKPNGWFVGLPHVRDGDVMFFVYLLVGLVLAARLWPELQRYRAALAMFGTALAVAVAVAAVDALPEAEVARWPWRRFWTSAYEEIGENLAEMFFLLAFLQVLIGRLKALRTALEARNDHEPV